MRMAKHVLASALLGSVGMLSAGAASAALIHTSTANCGGFSSCDDSAFVAAAGGATLTFNDFSVDRFGGVLPANGSVNGNIYSADFTLSSGASGFGGSNSPMVQHGNGSGFASEVGPVGGFDGRLIIDFAAPMTAVGFGSVEHGPANETISVFGLGNVLLGTFAGVAGTFDYEGFVATAGDVITRIILDGDFYAIQNIQYAAATVDEPGSISLLGLSLLGVAGVATRRRREQQLPEQGTAMA